MALCLLILDECGVACTPGLDFDPLRGGKYIRFSFSGETSVFTLQAHCLLFFRGVFIRACKKKNWHSLSARLYWWYEGGLPATWAMVQQQKKVTQNKKEARVTQVPRLFLILFLLIFFLGIEAKWLLERARRCTAFLLSNKQGLVNALRLVAKRQRSMNAFHSLKQKNTLEG